MLEIRDMEKQLVTLCQHKQTLTAGSCMERVMKAEYVFSLLVVLTSLCPSHILTCQVFSIHCFFVAPPLNKQNSIIMSVMEREEMERQLDNAKTELFAEQRRAREELESMQEVQY